MHAAERLHPFEHAQAFPRAATAFADVRRTRVAESTLPVQLAENTEIHDGRLRHRSWRARVEVDLAAGHVNAAVALLAQRPGELLRRLDHLLRLTERQDAVLAALPGAARDCSPAVLLATLGAVRRRGESGALRVFFPADTTPRLHVSADERRALPADLVERVVAILCAEVLRRAAALPAADRLRLFLHWMQSDAGPRVDLDLSVAMFGEGCKHVGTCDYTDLRAG